MQNRHAGELQALVMAHARDKVRGCLENVIMAFTLCLLLCVYVFASYSLRGIPCLFVLGVMSFGSCHCVSINVCLLYESK